MKKKNKLYTANKWNQPLFAQGIDREHQNIFDGLLSSNMQNIGTTSVLGNPTKIDLGAISSMKLPSQSLGLGKKLILGAKDVAKSGAGAIGGVVGSIGNKAISGGLSSGAGNVISNVGGTLGSAISTINPVVGGIVSAASGIIGGGVNALFGTKVNQAKLNAANESTNYLNSFKSNASSFDEIQGPNAVAKVQNAYKGGLFRKGKARRQNAALRAERAQSVSWANRSVNNNINNIADTQMDNLLANYAAFGGPLGGLPSQGTGAIDYNFMSDYLVAKNKSAEAKNKISTNVFGNLPVTPLSTFALGGGIHIKKSHRGLFTKEAKEHGMGVQEFASHVLANKDKYSPEVVKRANFARNSTKFALGGDMQTNGSDFSNGLMHIDAGLSHEENPYDGVQLGTDSQGKPNLVEEGETIFDDYVFSKRIKADAQTKKRFHVGKNADISYADLSKKLEKESTERPNDAISQAGLEKQMHDLADEQERQKSEMQAKEAQEVFASLPPDQQRAIMQQIAMEEQQAQQQQMEQPTEEVPQQAEQQITNEQMVQQPVEQTTEEPQMNACGGKINKYDKGGDMKQKFYNLLSPYVDGGIHTDSDFDKWLLAQKLDRITDWDNILSNKAFMDAVSAQNPALGDAISKGYDFGTYIPSVNKKYDLSGFSRVLDDYKASKVPGNTNGNYAIDKNFNYGKHKNIKELEADPNYKAYTDYMLGVIDRAKGIRYKSNSDDYSYKNIKWEDPNKKLSEDDYNALLTLADTANGTSVNPDGTPVALFNVSDDYTSLVDNAGDIFKKLRYDGKAGRFHLTPTLTDRRKQVINKVVDANGNVETIIGDVPKDWTSAGNYSWQDDKSDYTYNYYKRPVISTDGTDNNGDNQEEIVPKHKNEKLRYAGLLGPLVGLGMQAMGIGKPNYSRMDAAVEAASGAPALASYKPIGNYLTYNPMDIWYEQNRMDANSRATDRAILNNTSPIGTKMAGLLANGYNSQIADGDLYRKALEYNDVKRQKVAEFNRGTDMYNADAFTKTSATNAEIANRQRQFRAQMQMDAARQRMAADAAWNQGIYGNVSSLFKGISDLGRENAQHNMIADMAADGIFGVMTPKSNTGRKVVTTKKSCGGKIKRKRGLTF